MATVEQNAEAEADKKHLTGARRQAYIGGAFHRAAAWHDRATTPKTGKGAKHLSRRAKRMALADERQGEENRARIREMQTNAGKFRLKALRQRELPGNSGTAPSPEPKVAQKVEKAPKVPTLKLRQPLVPIKQAPANFYLQTTSETDPYWIQEYYGDKQLPRALEMQTEGNLKEAIAVVERKTGKKYTGGRSKAAMKKWLVDEVTGKASQPASAPAPQTAAKAQAAAPSVVGKIDPKRLATYGAQDPYALREMYGDGVGSVLQRTTFAELRQMAAKVQQRNPGTKPRGNSRQAVIDYIEQHTK